jgi:hypothetical protein
MAQRAFSIDAAANEAVDDFYQKSLDVSWQFEIPLACHKHFIA